MNIDLPSVMHEVPSKDALKAEFGGGWWLAEKLAKKIVLRTRLSEAQNHRCCYCARETNDIPDHSLQATIEHVFARSRGGQDVYEHTVMACAKCNHRRGNRVIADEREFLCESVPEPA